MTWSVPKLFHQMPAALIPEVRLALLAIGLSTALTLPFGTFLSTFIGLQQYLFPTIVATSSRVGSAAALIVLLFMHGSLVELAMVMAAFNVASAASQFLGWRRFVKTRVGFSFLFFDRRSAVKLAKYGSALSIWTLAMLLISGLDIVIVGHFDYRNTGFYAVASSITNFMLLVVGSIFWSHCSRRFLHASWLYPQPHRRARYQGDSLLYSAALPAWTADSIWSLSIALALGRAPICNPKRALP